MLDTRVATDVEDGARDWDAFVTCHPHGHFLQLSSWARFRLRQGWSALRVEQRDGSGQLVAGAQILTRRAGGTTFAYAPRGPVCGPRGDGWPALRAVMREQTGPHCVALRVEPHWWDEPAARAALRDAGLRETDGTQPPSTVRIDLTPDEDALLGAMKQKWRYNVRLAARRGIQVVEGGAADLDRFEALMAETAERDGFPSRSGGYYAAAWRALGPDTARLYMACFEDRPIAGIFVVESGDTATYLYGASSNSERKRMPNHRLQWEAMRGARRRGIRWYDLWGIPDALGRAVVDGAAPEDVRPEAGGLWGVWQFKRGFGGAVCRTVGAWDDVYAPVRYWAGLTLLPRLRRLRRRS